MLSFGLPTALNLAVHGCHIGCRLSCIMMVLKTLTNTSNYKQAICQIADCFHQFDIAALWDGNAGNRCAPAAWRQQG